MAAHRGGEVITSVFFRLAGQLVPVPAGLALLRS
jgi:hypothetical protein